MENRRVKFAISIAILLGAVLWLGMSGIEEGKSYYKTANEYAAMDAALQSRRIRLMGDVADGSLKRAGGKLSFDVTLNGSTVPVIYTGSDPVPDTFKEGASVLVEGSRGSDGVFVGQKIQAKCASKYEADPSQAYGGANTSVPTSSPSNPYSR